MIPLATQDPSLRVAIAPTPSTQCQLTANLLHSMQYDDQKQAKVALTILQQPPEIWYKDQFGRKATFELQVKRTETWCTQCVEQRIMTVKLLYESGCVDIEIYRDSRALWELMNG